MSSNKKLMRSFMKKVSDSNIKIKSLNDSAFEYSITFKVKHEKASKPKSITLNACIKYYMSASTNDLYLVAPSLFFFQKPIPFHYNVSPTTGRWFSKYAFEPGNWGVGKLSIPELCNYFQRIWTEPEIDAPCDCDLLTSCFKHRGTLYKKWKRGFANHPKLFKMTYDFHTDELSVNYGPHGKRVTEKITKEDVGSSGDQSMSMAFVKSNLIEKDKSIMKEVEEQTKAFHQEQEKSIKKDLKKKLKEEKKQTLKEEKTSGQSVRSSRPVFKRQSTVVNFRNFTPPKEEKIDYFEKIKEMKEVVNLKRSKGLLTLGIALNDYGLSVSLKNVEMTLKVNLNSQNRPTSAFIHPPIPFHYNIDTFTGEWLSSVFDPAKYWNPKKPILNLEIFVQYFIYMWYNPETQYPIKSKVMKNLYKKRKEKYKCVQRSFFDNPERFERIRKTMLEYGEKGLSKLISNQLKNQYFPPTRWKQKTARKYERVFYKSNFIKKISTDVVKVGTYKRSMSMEDLEEAQLIIDVLPTKEELKAKTPVKKKKKKKKKKNIEEEEKKREKELEQINKTLHFQKLLKSEMKTKKNQRDKERMKKNAIEMQKNVCFARDKFDIMSGSIVFVNKYILLFNKIKQQVKGKKEVKVHFDKLNKCYSDLKKISQGEEEKKSEFLKTSVAEIERIHEYIKKCEDLLVKGTFWDVYDKMMIYPEKEKIRLGLKGNEEDFTKNEEYMKLTKEYNLLLKQFMKAKKEIQIVINLFNLTQLPFDESELLSWKESLSIEHITLSEFSTHWDGFKKDFQTILKKIEDNKVVCKKEIVKLQKQSTFIQKKECPEFFKNEYKTKIKMFDFTMVEDYLLFLKYPTYIKRNRERKKKEEEMFECYFGKNHLKKHVEEEDRKILDSIKNNTFVLHEQIKQSLRKIRKHVKDGQNRILISSLPKIQEPFENIDKKISELQKIIDDNVYLGIDEKEFYFGKLSLDGNPTKEEIGKIYYPNGNIKFYGLFKNNKRIGAGIMYKEKKHGEIEYLVIEKDGKEHQVPMDFSNDEIKQKVFKELHM